MLARLTDSPFARFPVRILRSFVEHRGLVRAASLSYTTLLALVPLLAVVLSVSTVFLKNQDPDFLTDKVDRFLAYALPQLQVMGGEESAAAREDVFGRIREAIDRVNAGALGTFGAITLATVGITLLSAIEAALNNVWGITHGRPLTQRIFFYWAGVTLGPMLLFFSIGLTSSGLVASVLGTLPGVLESALFRFVLPFLALAGGFTLLYKAMPNTLVPLRAAMWGGLTAGALFQLNNLASAAYVSQVVTYSRVYGSLGAIPIVMVGLYLAWAIVLVGAEVAYAAATPLPEETPLRYPESFEERSRLALEVSRIAAARYMAGAGGAASDEIAKTLRVPLDWVNRTATILTRCGVLAGGGGGGDDAPVRYFPAKPPSSIPALDVLDGVRQAHAEDGAGERSPAVSTFLSRRESAERTALSDVTLADLAAGEEKEGT